jgi:hypothetical protein
MPGITAYNKLAVSESPPRKLALTDDSEYKAKVKASAPPYQARQNARQTLLQLERIRRVAASPETRFAWSTYRKRETARESFFGSIAFAFSRTRETAPIRGIDKLMNSSDSVCRISASERRSRILFDSGEFSFRCLHCQFPITAPPYRGE